MLAGAPEIATDGAVLFSDTVAFWGLSGNWDEIDRAT
jgi:hypothetical protein